VKHLPFHLHVSQESDGTRRLLDMLPILKRGLDQPSVVVMDEFDRSLHPLLAWDFMQSFLEGQPGAQSQLIVTTHDTHLMHHDLLRRDEIWFVEKDEKQQSRLYSLADFNVRNDLRLEKGYLLGRFGGIPQISDPLPPDEEPGNVAEVAAGHAP